MTHHVTLTVCMGLPASGKSTYTRAHAGDALVVSADAIRTKGTKASAMFGKMYREAQAAIYDGRDVYVDACSLQWRDRQPWLAIAKRYGIRSRLVVFRTPLAVCRDRDRARRTPAGRLGTYAARMRESLGRIAREGWNEIQYVGAEGGTDATRGGQ